MPPWERVELGLFGCSEVHANSNYGYSPNRSRNDRPTSVAVIVPMSKKSCQPRRICVIVVLTGLSAIYDPAS
jgi:hypothetical protein